MHKMLMIGVMLLGTFSCKPPTIKEPIKMYVVNLEFDEAGFARKNLDIRTKDDSVTQWVDELSFVRLSEAPKNLMCFSLEDWLKIVKPKIKEGNQYYKDYQ